LLATLLCASSALANPGTNLRWNACFGDSGLANKTFACNTNSGTFTLVLSFVLPVDFSNASGLEIVLDVSAPTTSIPAWWLFKNAGSCRVTSLTENPVLPPASVHCVDWGRGTASSGLAAYNVGVPGPGHCRVLAAAAVAPQDVQNLVAGPEYFAGNFVIDAAKTVGAGASSGCDVPMTISCPSVRVVTPTTGLTITGPTNGTNSHIATWQSAPVATRRNTWAGVKALYR